MRHGVTASLALLVSFCLACPAFPEKGSPVSSYPCLSRDALQMPGVFQHSFKGKWPLLRKVSSVLRQAPETIHEKSLLVQLWYLFTVQLVAPHIGISLPTPLPNGRFYVAVLPHENSDGVDGGVIAVVLTFLTGRIP